MLSALKPDGPGTDQISSTPLFYHFEMNARRRLNFFNVLASFRSHHATLPESAIALSGLIFAASHPSGSPIFFTNWPLLVNTWTFTQGPCPSCFPGRHLHLERGGCRNCPSPSSLRAPFPRNCDHQSFWIL